MRAARFPTATAGPLCDIRQLHTCLRGEVNAQCAELRRDGVPPGASVNVVTEAERQLLDEMRRVLVHAVEYNRRIVSG